MRTPFSTLGLVLASALVLVQAASAQWSSPPRTDAEVEAQYSVAIENRTVAILKALSLADAGKSNTVHDAVVAQYHALRARDAAIDAQLKAEGKEINYTNRAGALQAQSKPLHDKFLALLADSLTSEQVEQVKDRMTYNKVKVTYDAYCEIVPGLTDAEKAKILEELKLAREEAMDGGNATEKSDIFQKYKDRINAYLNANGHDVAKATQEWQAKEDAAKKLAGGTATSPAK